MQDYGGGFAMTSGRMLTLSGDGTTVWLVQADGRLTRVDLDSGKREPISEPLPGYVKPGGPAAPGSLFRLLGPPEANPRSASKAADLKVSVFRNFQSAETNLQVTAVGPGYLGVQIPWEFSTPGGDSTGLYRVWRDGGQFDTLIARPSGPSASWAPAFELINYSGLASLTNGDDLIKASHQDFHGPVTESDPARPGEIVHVYMTGLGPVSPAQTTGVTAPGEPPAMVLAAVTASLTASDPTLSTNVQVLWAGLVPGNLGLYQVDLQLPDHWPASSTLQVLISSGTGAAGRLALAQ